MAEFVEVINQKNRMCDSIVNANGGEGCNKCQLYTISHGGNCNTYICMNPERAEKIIMEWVEEHPIKTNADKFKEVFGVDISRSSVGCPVCGDYCVNVGYHCASCKYHKYWKQEYKEVTDDK